MFPHFLPYFQTNVPHIINHRSTVLLIIFQYINYLFVLSLKTLESEYCDQSQVYQFKVDFIYIQYYHDFCCTPLLNTPKHQV